MLSCCLLSQYLGAYPTQEAAASALLQALTGQQHVFQEPAQAATADAGLLAANGQLATAAGSATTCAADTVHTVHVPAQPGTMQEAEAAGGADMMMDLTEQAGAGADADTAVEPEPGQEQG